MVNSLGVCLIQTTYGTHKGLTIQINGFRLDPSNKEKHGPSLFNNDSCITFQTTN